MTDDLTPVTPDQNSKAAESLNQPESKQRAQSAIHELAEMLYELDAGTMRIVIRDQHNAPVVGCFVFRGEVADEVCEALDALEAGWEEEDATETPIMRLIKPDAPTIIRPR